MWGILSGPGGIGTSIIWIDDTGFSQEVVIYSIDKWRYISWPFTVHSLFKGDTLEIV